MIGGGRKGRCLGLGSDLNAVSFVWRHGKLQLRGVGAEGQGKVCKAAVRDTTTFAFASTSTQAWEQRVRDALRKEGGEEGYSPSQRLARLSSLPTDLDSEERDKEILCRSTVLRGRARESRTDVPVTPCSVLEPGSARCVVRPARINVSEMSREERTRDAPPKPSWLLR